MAFLVDTNVVSELRKGDRANEGVRRWFEQTREDEVYLSVLVIGELRKGIENLRLRDATSAVRLDRWLGQLVDGAGERILGVCRETAELWGRLNSPDPLPTVDSLMAATAQVHGHVLVTRNVRDVERTGVTLLDPFD